MWFTDSLASWFQSIANFFYSAYVEVFNWPWPFYNLAPPLYSICTAFTYLAYYTTELGSWLDYVASQIAQLLSWDTVWSYIQLYAQPLLDILKGLRAAWDFVLDRVKDWWSSTQYTVLGWVQGAKDFASSLIAGLESALTNLQSAWDSFKGKIPSIDQVVAWWSNWWGNVLGQLGSWWNQRLPEVQGLIGSLLAQYEPFWRGWQEIRDKVTGFFADPDEWIYAAIERILTRFW